MKNTDGTEAWTPSNEPAQSTAPMISNSLLIDLLACPFCGKAAAEVVEDYKGSFIACCTFCGATSHRMYSRDAAANKWNRRAG